MYDRQRIAVTEQVNRNHDKFVKRNLAVAMEAQDTNFRLEQEKNEFCHAAKESEKD